MLLSLDVFCCNAIIIYYRYVLKGKVHPCTGTKSLYRPYAPQGEQRYRYTVQVLRLCTGRMAHRGIEVQLYSFLTTALEGGQRHAPTALYPRGKTRYPFQNRLFGPQGRSGQLRKISPLTGFRSPDRSARSQSYRLSYPAFYCYVVLSIYLTEIYRKWATLCVFYISLIKICSCPFLRGWTDEIFLC